MDIKKILVPTDFSHAANNALCYAADIAEQCGAEVEIVHAYIFPVLTARGNPVLADSDVGAANRKVAEEQLENTKKMVSGRHSAKFSLVAIPIHWEVELAEVIHNRKSDLIVIGTTGASGLKKAFMGSNAARVIQDSPAPVLVVPEKSKLSQLSKIGFAYDGLEVKKIEKLSIINSFRNIFKTNFYIFQIINSEQSRSPYLSELIDFLSGAEYNDIEDSDVDAGILKCIELNHLDMLIMLPRKRGFFHNLISGSITERVAYEIPVPLLAIPE